MTVSSKPLSSRFSADISLEAWYKRIPYHIEEDQIFIQTGGEYAELWNEKGQTIHVI